MSDERPITPQQAAIAVRAAGLDPDRPLSEQLDGEEKGGIEQQLADLSAKVDALVERSQGKADQSTEARPHEELARQLAAAQSRWHTFGRVADEDAAA